jgi:alpha-L-arabinofuranosidase
MKLSLMRKLRILLNFLILCGMVSVNLIAQAPAVIKIDFDRKIGVVDPNIYSGFIEPIRTVVYGNVYDPASPLADENGFRKDFIQLIKELKVRTLRWPGGNFIASYYWQDGIGPKDQRPARLDLAWNQIEKNQMGTDEYVKLTNLIGAENFVCINGGTGTVHDATNWLEYCNYEKGTYFSDLRRKYGNEKPYGIKYWALGNEVDGPWQMAQKNAEDYVKWALEAQKMMNIVDKNIKYIGSGASNYTPKNEWIDWNDYILQNLAGKIDYISVHRYATEALGTDRSFSGMMSLGIDIDQKIEMVQALIKKAILKTGAKRPIYISFDEYSGGGDNLTGSLVLAQHLNSFIRHADVVKMANITMLTSLVGIAPDGDYKNATYNAFYLFSNNCTGTSLDVNVSCEKFSNNFFTDVPFLDVTALLNETGNILVVNVVNRHETNAIPADIVLQTGAFAGTAKVSELNGKNLTARSTKTEPAVSVSTKDIKFKGNTINFSFPAHSFTQLEIPLK